MRTCQERMGALHIDIKASSLLAAWIIGAISVFTAEDSMHVLYFFTRKESRWHSVCIADFVVKQQAVELQTAYNAHLGLQQTAQLRATKLAMATVAAESMVKAAEGDAATIKLRADAELYTETKRAEAIQVSLLM